MSHGGKLEMRAWKKWDRFFNKLSWIVLGLEVVYVAARFILPAEMAADIDRYAV